MYICSREQRYVILHGDCYVLYNTMNISYNTGQFWLALCTRGREILKIKAFDSNKKFHGYVLFNIFVKKMNKKNGLHKFFVQYKLNWHGWLVLSLSSP